jgi:hypothetical protein
MFKVTRTIIRQSPTDPGLINSDTISNLHNNLISLLNQLPPDKFIGVETNHIDDVTSTITYIWADESYRNEFLSQNQTLINDLQNAIDTYTAQHNITTYVTTETV